MSVDEDIGGHEVIDEDEAAAAAQTRLISCTTARVRDGCDEVGGEDGVE